MVTINLAGKPTGALLATRLDLCGATASVEIALTDDSHITITIDANGKSTAICMTPAQFCNLQFAMEAYIRDQQLES